MGWLNFGGKKRDRAQGFGDSSKTKSRKRPKSFILEKIVTPSAGFGDWEHEFDQLHQLLGSLSLSDLHLPNFFADGGVCPIDPDAPTNNLPPLIDFDPLGLYHDGIATQTPYNPGGAFETLPIALIPVDPQAPNPSNPNAIRQLLDSPFASQPLLGSIDTGVSADSPYLNYANIKKGRDYVGGDDNPLLKPGEGSEHGTFMLGIIDAINKTAPKWVGRAIDSGRWADSLVEFVDAAKASGQKNAIANLSLDLTQKNADGSVTTRYELTPQERSAIEYARQNGVMLVVAAGNDGGVMSVLGQASQEFDNIFTVGAGDINGRSIYSSYGRGLDILADGGTNEHPALSTAGNDLGTMAGTSVATAKVAGAASLVWAANPALNYRQVMEILKSTARDLGPSGWDDETGFGFLNTLAAVDLAKKTKPEVYNPTPWVTPGTWSGEGKVTPEERAAKGGNSIAAATVQVLTNFSDSDRVDASQPDKYYQFTVNEPGYVKWNLTSLNPVSGFPTPPNVTIIKADGKPGSHIFSKGISLGSSMIREGQTSFSGGNFYDPGTYYLKVGNGAGSTFKDYNISTQFTADRVSSFAGNIQYRTQPYYSLQDSPQSAVFSGPAVSELKNLAGVVTYDNIQVNNRIAKYGIEVNESGKFRINLNSPNGKMELSVKKFIGSDDRPESIASLAVSANSDGWLELDLNKGRYDIEVKTPSNYWQEPDWNSTQQRLVRPYTLNATFTPNAPQPGQGKVPVSAGVFDKTVVSSGVVNHYYKNGYLTVQPSGQASWYGYPSLVISGSAQVISKPVPLTDPDGNYSIQTAQNLLLTSGGADLGDGVNKDQVASGRILSSIGGKDLNDFYKFSLNSSKLVNLELSQLGSGAEWSLIKDRNGNGKVDPGEVIKLGNIVTESQKLDLILGAGNYYLQIGSAAPNAASQYVVNVVATPPENEVISSYNSDYYLVQNGQRRLVSDRETLNGLGINPNTVKRFSNEDLALIPLGQPLSPLIPQWQKSIDDAANQNSLGNPVTSYWDAADSPTGTKGYGRTYDRGSVYWTAKSGAIALVGQFADAYHNPNGGSNGWLGFPTAKQWNWEGGQRIDFEGGYIYRTAKEGIRAFKYDESPWQKSIDAEYAGHQGLLGNPTTGYWDAADSPTGTKGYGQNYNNGHVFWTAKYGAIALWRDFADTYNQNGGSNGWLGFPTKGKEDWQGGQRIEFEGGYIYWTAKEGARAFKNGELPWEKSIAAEYAGHQGLLGNPTTGYLPAADSQYGTKGYHQNYNNGHVFWTAKSGAIALWGDFANTYNQNGGSNKWLGFPTQGKRDWLGGERIDFEGGYIYRTAQNGTRAFKHGELPAETINRKPVINFPDFQMPYGASFSLQTYANQLQISDPDGDAIQFYEISVDPSRVGMEAWTLEGQPLGKYLIPADKFNTINFYGSVLGSNPVVVRAFDGKEWSDPKSFNITVVPSSNTGGVAITPGNGGSSSTTSPSPTPAPVSGKGVTIRTGAQDDKNSTKIAALQYLKELFNNSQELTNVKDEYVKRLYGEQSGQPRGQITSTLGTGKYPYYMDETHIGIDSSSNYTVSTRSDKKITVKQLGLTKEGLIDYSPVKPSLELKAGGFVYPLVGGQVIKVVQGRIEDDKSGSSVSSVSIWNPDLKRLFIYLHLSQVAPLFEGQWINPGNWIGIEGTTGNSNGLHTHVEVHPYFEGEPVVSSSGTIITGYYPSAFHYESYNVEDPLYTMKLAKESQVWDKTYSNRMLIGIGYPPPPTFD